MNPWYCRLIRSANHHRNIEIKLRFPNPKDGTWKQRQLPYTAWDFFPPAYDCPFEMERLGNFGDGGKWICGISQYAAFEERPLIVYSFGVDEDSSFEAELVDRTSAYIYAFDYSVDNMGPEVANGTKSNVKFSKIGLGGHDETIDGNQFMTLPSIMSELGHDYVDILKMDIEGAEFDALDVLMETYNGSNLPFGQIMIEFHLWAAPQNIRDLVAWWERLERFGLRPVAQESNPLGVILGPGYPCCYEVRNCPSSGKRYVLTIESTSLSTLETIRAYCSFKKNIKIVLGNRNMDIVMVVGL